MKRIYALSALVISFNLAARPDVDALFAQFDKPGVPGAAVAVLRNGLIEYEKGYGLQNLEGQESVSVKTNFRLASVSKQFTAMAVLLLVQKGQLKLETTLREVFPDFPSYGEKIQIRHLLNHTGGLRDYEDLVTGAEQILDDGVLKLMMQQTSTIFTPGSQYRYSNGGYCVLAMVVEKISGMPFAQFAQLNIFDAIGMKDSQFFVKDESTIENRAYGYSEQGSAFVKTDQSNTSATKGDGGVYTSVHEWVKWDNALTQSKLLSIDLQTMMFTPGTLNNGSHTQYGFGYMLDTYKGRKRQHHTGSTIGFRTVVQRYPDEGLTVVVLINRANANPSQIAERVADLYLNH